MLLELAVPFCSAAFQAYSAGMCFAEEKAACFLLRKILPEGHMNIRETPSQSSAMTCTNFIWSLQVRHGGKRPIFHTCISEMYCSEPIASGFLWNMVLLCFYTDSNAVGSQAWLAAMEATSEITIFMVFIIILIRVFTFILHTYRQKKGTRELRNLKFFDFGSNAILWLSWTDLLSSCVH